MGKGCRSNTWKPCDIYVSRVWWSLEGLIISWWEQEVNSATSSCNGRTLNPVWNCTRRCCGQRASFFTLCGSHFTRRFFDFSAWSILGAWGAAISLLCVLHELRTLTDEAHRYPQTPRSMFPLKTLMFRVSSHFLTSYVRTSHECVTFASDSA